MSEPYSVVSPFSTHAGDSDSLPDSKDLAAVLLKDGQFLLPLVDLVEQAQVAIDDLVDVMGRATIEAVLQMSAAQLAGPKQQGRFSLLAPLDEPIAKSSTTGHRKAGCSQGTPAQSLQASAVAAIDG